MAIIDENGNTISEKYNLITGELTAKIDKSWVYSVVDNEKAFSDIKNKSIWWDFVIITREEKIKWVFQKKEFFLY